MIILTRKKDQSIVVGPAKITVDKIDGDEVELRIEGEDLEVLTREDWEAKQREKERQKAEEAKTG